MIEIIRDLDKKFETFVRLLSFLKQQLENLETVSSWISQVFHIYLIWKGKHNYVLLISTIDL